MPQLAQASQIYASQLFWLVVVFALIYFGVGRAMVPRIERTMDDRAARITADLASAEQARGQAKAADEGYQSGLDTARAAALRAVGEAQAQAAAALEAKTKAGDAETAARIDEATSRIDQARRAALGEIEGATVDAAQAIVAKLSGATVDRAVAEQAVRGELAAHG